VSCGNGVLGRFTGCDVMKILKNFKKTLEHIVWKVHHFIYTINKQKIINLNINNLIIYLTI